MHWLSKIALTTGFSLLSSLSHAQSIDLGRGELPVTVPDDYSADTPSPLIVLLHGYTSSGAMSDRYMGLSAIALPLDDLVVVVIGVERTC